MDTETKPAKENRDERLDTRVSADESRQIRAYATEAGLSVSAYLRRSALRRSIAMGLSQEERQALVGLGRNLNQAMKLAHANGAMTTQLQTMIEQVRAILHQ